MLFLDPESSFVEKSHSVESAGNHQLIMFYPCQQPAMSWMRRFKSMYDHNINNLSFAKQLKTSKVTHFCLSYRMWLMAHILVKIALQITAPWHNGDRHYKVQESGSGGRGTAMEL